MNGKLLIDAIVRQTMVLVAQLSTAAGIRAPLSPSESAPCGRPFSIMSASRAASSHLIRYPNAREIFTTADAGGSNGYRSRMWKHELQVTPYSRVPVVRQPVAGHLWARGEQ